MKQEIRDILAHLGERDEQYPFSRQYSFFELAGRFYPCCIDISIDINELQEPRAVSLRYWEWQEIPFAIGPRHAPGIVSFAKRSLAKQYIIRQEQEFYVLWDCSHIAALSEEYPERNAWYREEIARLIAQHAKDYHSYSSRDLIDVQFSRTCEANIWLWLNWHASKEQVRLNPLRLTGKGVTIDEALEQLYQRCYEQWGADEALKQLTQHYAEWIADEPDNCTLYATTL